MISAVKSELVSQSLKVESPSYISKEGVQSGWLVSPTFDLLLVANVLWPLIAVLAVSTLTFISEPISILQLYFLSSPHRWITLALIFGGKDRFWKEPVKYGGITVGMLCVGILLFWLSTVFPYFANSFAALLMLDYFWNSWHFAAQHAGIARIYERKMAIDPTSNGEDTKSSLRILVLWTYLQIAFEIGSSRAVLGDETLNLLHLIFIPISIAVIGHTLFILNKKTPLNEAYFPPSKIYSLSVISLYAAQLIAIRFSVTWMNAFLLTAAVYHSVEYMAVVSWSVRRRTDGIWQLIIPRLKTAFAIFIVVLGVINWIAATRFKFAWVLATLLVSLLHYCYDGIIWKAPAPKKS